MDHRDVAAAQRRDVEFVEKRMMLKYLPGSPDEFDVPAKFDVCGTCDGKGSHVNPGIDSNGITSDEMWQDPEFAEDYFRGVYDVPCYECHGRRVIAVPVTKDDRVAF